MRVLVAGAWLAALLVPSPIQEGDTEITGVVRFTGDHKPRLLNKRIDGMKHGAAPRGEKEVPDEDVVLGANGELANCLVWVKRPPETGHPVPKETVEVDAAGYFFKPRVVVVRPGQTFRLKNSGLDTCNFHLKARVNKEINVNLVKGSERSVQFGHSEHRMMLRHDCCPWMIAWVHALDHPYFAVTGADGKFSIPKLPAGTHVLRLWHEKFGDRQATITVGSKENKTQDFTFDR